MAEVWTTVYSSGASHHYLSRTDYQKEWGKGYRRPGFGAKVLAFFLKIIPKIGPFQAYKSQIDCGVF
jgi:hypothetical protein